MHTLAGQVKYTIPKCNSSLYERAINGTILPDWKRLISGVKLFLIIFILRNPAYSYPALPYVMKPYPETPRLQQKKEDTATDNVRQEC